MIAPPLQRIPMGRAGCCLLIVASILSCGRASSSGSGQSAAAADSHQDEPPTDPNRIAVPAAVRQNLGITFAKVERRAIENTLRAPGRFELLPSAHAEYHTAIAGRVELHVRELEHVVEGQPLYTLRSLSLHGIQERLAGAEADMLRLKAELDAYPKLQAAHTRHESMLEVSIGIGETRVEQLQKMSDAGGGRSIELINARASLATAQAELAGAQETEAELDINFTRNQLALASQTQLFEILLNTLTSDTGISRDDLLAEITAPNGAKGPAWHSLNEVVVKAHGDGRVETLGETTGAWVDERTIILTTVRTDQLRFRAKGLQSDLGVLRDGLTASIVTASTPAATSNAAAAAPMIGTLEIGLGADPASRTIDLVVRPETLAPWARPGVTAQLEIQLDGDTSQELAIPMSAVRQDGLHAVFFRRNPKNLSEVIRIEGDFGSNDGRWISVLSGLRDGDEVVLDGSFQLMLATSGTQQKGGHFHADGTFHEDGH